MKLRILCLDDNLQTLRQPLHSILGPMLSEGSIPELSGGISEPFKIDGFGEKQLQIEITSNSQNAPEKVVQEIESIFINTRSMSFLLMMTGASLAILQDNRNYSHVSFQQYRECVPSCQSSSCLLSTGIKSIE